MESLIVDLQGSADLLVHITLRIVDYFYRTGWRIVSYLDYTGRIIVAESKIYLHMMLSTILINSVHSRQHSQ